MDGRPKQRNKAAFLKLSGALNGSLRSQRDFARGVLLFWRRIPRATQAICTGPERCLGHAWGHKTVFQPPRVPLSCLSNARADPFQSTAMKSSVFSVRPFFSSQNKINAELSRTV